MNNLKLFQDKTIRTYHDQIQDKWYFSVIDIIGVLTKSSIPKRYWSDLKKKLFNEGSQLYAKIVQLKFPSLDGKNYTTDCLETTDILRLIQSIPSPKAEPFKLWLSQVGYERLQEIENPELAQERMKQLYEQKGYPQDWIDKRLRGIAIRQNLTDEWKTRGVTEERDYAILTAEISKATFGMTPSEYKEHKGLVKKNQNLRDHMTDLELIFSMLGERVTTEISQQEKPDSFDGNIKVAKRGGKVAGIARKETEKELGNSVISEQNFLPENNITEKISTKKATK